MKNIIKVLFFILLTSNVFGQKGNLRVMENSLPTIYITDDINVMFRSSEPIQFIDLSSENLVGDLPIQNVARIKLLKYSENGEFVYDSINPIRQEIIKYNSGENVGVVTIIGQSFMAQYKLVYVPKNIANEKGHVMTDVLISDLDMQPLEMTEYKLSDIELKKYCQNIVKDGKKGKVANSKEFLIETNINNIYTFDEYIFLDISFKNESDLIYDIGNVEFSIADKKIFKATTNQTLDIEPVFKLHSNSKFRKTFRNIYVFKKFTFPNDKVLKIRIYENGLSGRTLSTEMKYSSLLNADSL